jgi:hypothetical protein
MRFHNTRHVLQRVSDRGLTLESLKAVVAMPHGVEELSPGRNGGKLKRFRKTVDDKTLVVVAEVKGNECWLATAFYES